MDTTNQVETQGQLQLETALQETAAIPVKRGRGRPRKIVAVFTAVESITTPAAAISTTEYKTPASTQKARKHKKQKSNKKATKKVARKIRRTTRKYNKVVLLSRKPKTLWRHIKSLFASR